MLRKTGKYFAALALFIIIAVAVFIKGDYINKGKIKEASLNYGWELIMVNSEYAIPESYETDLLTLSNGERVDKKIYPDLQKYKGNVRWPLSYIRHTILKTVTSWTA